MNRALKNAHGFTYLAVLTIVIIMGIMLAMVGQSWKTITQRELEEELLYRGNQVADVVYQKLLCKNANFSQQTVNQFLWNVKTANGTILDDLVKTGVQENCVNSGQKTFRLRPSAALDPFTNEPWEIVTPATPVPQIASSVQPATESTVVLKPVANTATSSDTTRFSGVKSRSVLKPFKQKFHPPDEPPLPNQTNHYNEWFFTWELPQKMQATPVQPKIIK